MFEKTISVQSIVEFKQNHRIYENIFVNIVLIIEFINLKMGRELYSLVILMFID